MVSRLLLAAVLALANQHIDARHIPASSKHASQSAAIGSKRQGGIGSLQAARWYAFPGCVLPWRTLGTTCLDMLCGDVVQLMSRQALAGTACAANLPVLGDPLRTAPLHS